jgi:hypothetical protein
MDTDTIQFITPQPSTPIKHAGSVLDIDEERIDEYEMRR